MHDRANTVWQDGHTPKDRLPAAGITVRAGLRYDEYRGALAAATLQGPAGCDSMWHSIRVVPGMAKAHFVQRFALHIPRRLIYVPPER